MITFNHSGAIGDIIYSLHFCKELINSVGESKFNFHIKISNNNQFDPKRSYLNINDVNFIKPLLQSQQYINEVTYSEDVPQNCFNLDIMRKLNLNLMGGDMRTYWYNLYGKHLPREFWNQILFVEPNYRFKDKFLLTFTQRYVNVRLDYNVLKELKDRIVFIGLEKQYELFKSKFFDLEYVKVNNLLEAAQYMVGSLGFVGNESGLFSVAECLKVPRILLSPQLIYLNGTLCQGPFNVNPIGGWNEVAGTTEKFLYSVREMINFSLGEKSKFIKEEAVCPICLQKTDIFTLVKWNYYSGEDLREWKYHICQNCGCAFLNDMKNWTDEMYGNLIYNKDYILIDPSFNGIRARNLLPSFLTIFKTFNVGDYILDWGGGNGITVDMLRANGYTNSYCYDTYGRKDISVDANNFDYVLAIEVLEHVIEPRTLWKIVSDKIKVGGIFITTTELYRGQILENWYYANPRAGHCLLYSQRALLGIAHEFGFEKVECGGITNENLHIFRKVK